VFLAPLETHNPSKALELATQNLSDVLVEPTYMGFSFTIGMVRSEHQEL
jgi:hypothetical protein